MDRWFATLELSILSHVSSTEHASALVNWPIIVRRMYIADAQQECWNLLIGLMEDLHQLGSD